MFGCVRTAFLSSRVGQERAEAKVYTQIFPKIHIIYTSQRPWLKWFQKLQLQTCFLTGPFLACIRHSCLLCQLYLFNCAETVCMRQKVAQSIRGGAVKSFLSDGFP